MALNNRVEVGLFYVQKFLISWSKSLEETEMNKLLHRAMRLMLLLVLGVSFYAGAAELEGVKLPDSLKIANRDLALNGMGLRTRLGFKVYVAGLYVGARSVDATTLIQQPGAKRVAIVMRRNVEADTFLKALRDGISANHTEAQIAALKDRLEKFDEAINLIKEARQGDTIDLDYVPETGMQILHNGKPVGANINGEDFYRALLRIWLGEKPVQDSLKQGWLGKN
jgi:hypothetical protein